MTSWWRALGRTLSRLTDVGKRERIDDVKRKIRAHIEQGQTDVARTALFNYNSLVLVVEADEAQYLQDALDELVDDDVLERVVGRFYALKGRA